MNRERERSLLETDEGDDLLCDVYKLAKIRQVRSWTFFQLWTFSKGPLRLSDQVLVTASDSLEATKEVTHEGKRK